MKKIISFVFSVFVSASLLFAAEFSAEVVSVSGKAEVLVDSTWKSIAAGDSLKSGDMIQTGFKSSVVLKVKNSTVNVSPLTRMTVEQLSDNPEKDNVRLFVKAGGISSDVKKTDARKVGFTVRTPVATASVRGTEFSVQNKFNSTDVNTTRGSVAVWRGKNSVNVSSDSENSASYEEAPHGTVFVNANQGVVLTSGRMISSQKTVASEAVSVSGTTKTLAESTVQDKIIPAIEKDPSSEPEKKTTVSVTITVEE
jgi:hypothetical protein